VTPVFRGSLIRRNDQLRLLPDEQTDALGAFEDDYTGRSETETVRVTITSLNNTSKQLYQHDMQ